MSFPKRVNAMLANSGEESDLNLPNALIQCKYDGTRIFIEKENTSVWLYTRSWKNDVAPRFEKLISGIARIPHHSFIIDSELCFFNNKLGKFEFLTALATPETLTDYTPCLIAFDILELNGENLRDRRYEKRLEILTEVVKGNSSVNTIYTFSAQKCPLWSNDCWPRCINLNISTGICGDKLCNQALEHKTRFPTIDLTPLDYYNFLVSSGAEGVMIKDPNSPYREGERTNEWLKLKPAKDDDVIIVGVTVGKGRRAANFGALILAQYENGILREVGTSSGFTDEEQKTLLSTLESIKSPVPTLVNYKSRDVLFWVRPEIVAQIKYHERTEKGKFRWPAFIRVRDDKKAEECLFSTQNEEQVI
jgi:ATP-dependent DNA ligase